jgi:hypothetical protein
VSHLLRQESETPVFKVISEMPVILTSLAMEQSLHTFKRLRFDVAGPSGTHTHILGILSVFKNI